MSRLIRTYQAGGQVVLSDSVRARSGSDYFNQRAAEEQARQEALAQAVENRRKAAALLQQAQAEADRLLAEAQAQLQTAQAEAQAQGYEEGYSRGLAEGQTAAETAAASGIQQVQALLAEVSTTRQALLHGAEDQLATLAMAIAEKVIGQLSQSERDTILQMAQRALHELSVTGPFQIWVHPQDEAILQAHWQQNPPLRGEFAWTLRRDETIAPGGCLLQCGPTTVDARLSTQIKAIVHGLSLPNYLTDDSTPGAEDAA